MSQRPLEPWPATPVEALVPGQPSSFLSSDQSGEMRIAPARGCPHLAASKDRVPGTEPRRSPGEAGAVKRAPTPV